MFKDDLRKELKNNHMSQAELAKYLDCSPSSVSQWVLGKVLPDTSYLRNITELFDMSFERYMPEYVEQQERRRNGAHIRDGKVKIDRSTKDFDGEKLFELRKRKKMTQEELGEKLGWSKKAVSTWELGRKPSQRALEDICTYFNVKEAYFSPNVQEPFTPKERVRPEVKEKEKNWKNPYSKQLKDANEALDLAPIVETKVVDVQKPDEERDAKAIIKARAEALEEPYKLGQEIKQLKDKVGLIEFDYKLQIGALSDRFDDLQKQIEELRKLIIKFLLAQPNPDGATEATFATETQPIIVKNEPKKSFWERLIG